MRDDSLVGDNLRPAYFVPETKLVAQLFSEMRLGGWQMGHGYRPAWRRGGAW